MRLQIFLLASFSIGIIPATAQDIECDLWLEEYDEELKKCVHACGEGKVFNESADKCVDECSVLEVFDVEADKCVTGCGEGKYFDSKTNRCEDEGTSPIGCPIKCAAGQSYDTECRCIQKEDDCCVASTTDYDIRVTTASEGCAAGQCNKTCKDYGGECVQGYLCRNNIINTDGNGIITVYTTDEEETEEGCTRNTGTIDLSDKACPNSLTCCLHPKSDALTYQCNEDEECQVFSDYSECGRIADKDQNIRLVDSKNEGKELDDYQAQLGEFPHMCLFYSNVRGSRAYLGGASLIGTRFLLTTAHKFYIKRGADITDIREDRNLVARCGELNVKNSEPNFPDPQDRPILKVLTHPEYNPDKLSNNIAIIYVSQPFKYQKHISPVCLPKPNTDFTGNTDCFSTGWGADSYDNAEYSDLLKKVQLSVVDSTKCEQTINNLDRFKNRKNFLVYDNWICVGGEGEKDTCRGDGGSPHVCRINNKWVQVGAVAFGFGCGQDGIPSIYSGVAPEICWIDWVMSCQEKIPRNFSLTEVVDIRQSENVPVTVESKNQLKRRDCQEWLIQNQDLALKCEVSYI